LAVDLYAPNFAFLASEPDRPFTLRVEFDLPSGHHVIRRDRLVSGDITNQVQHSELRFEEYDAGGLLVRERTLPLYTRYTFRYELQLLLERAGLEVVDVFRTMTGTPTTVRRDHCVARRPAR